VRARIAGVLQKRVYTEGSDVKEGQLLFQIDPAPLQAALNAQQANLAAATGDLPEQPCRRRARPFDREPRADVKDRLDNAEAAERTAPAAVKQAQANVDSAKNQPGYASSPPDQRTRRPAAGHRRRARSAGRKRRCSRIVEQIDPIYANFSQAVGERTTRATPRDRQRRARRGRQGKNRVLRTDGSATPSGTAGLFSDTAVDAATGAVSLRGIVPNPDHNAVAGMYVNVRVSLGERKHAWLDQPGGGAARCDRRVRARRSALTARSQKRITADSMRGDSWIITDWPRRPATSRRLGHTEGQARRRPRARRGRPTASRHQAVAPASDKH
jgi:membrane fusion protein (multidrug efflux system)